MRSRVHGEKKKKGKKAKFGVGAVVGSAPVGEVLRTLLTEAMHRGVEHYFGKGKKKQTVKRLEDAIKRLTSRPTSSGA